MARASGPYSAAFPVNFTSGGDTTRDAFKKHMDEIARIYGILTDFDKDIPDADSITGQLTTHINSTNPHPNYKPSVSWSDVTNKPGLNDLSGTLTASKVVGVLTGATIASGNVTGLEAFVNGKIPASSDKGDGITEKSLSDLGYVKFNNGLILQWGNQTINTSSNSYQTGEITFPKSFTSSCYAVTLTARPLSGTAFNGGSTEGVMLVNTPTTTGFRAGIVPPNKGNAIVYYLAIGV